MTHAEALVANDSTKAGVARRRAAFELFRQLQPPVVLGEIGRALEGPIWLSDLDVVVVDDVGGKLPVTWQPEDTIVTIRIFPEVEANGSPWTVYLRISGRHERAAIFACLRNGGEGPTATATVVEVALSS